MDLHTKNIDKSFGKKQVLADITITVPDRQIVSILGPSGVGKSTLFNIIAGLDLPDAGSVLLGSEKINGQTGKVAYMLQKDLLLPYKTIMGNLSLPMILRGEKKKTAEETAGRYLKEFGLEDVKDKYPKALSGGMRQRAALLRTYLFSSEIMLLDEPFSALDALTKSDMHQWFLKIKQDLGLTILLITHDIEEALQLSDRIYVLGGSPARVVYQLDQKKASQGEDYLFSAEYLQKKQEILEVIHQNGKL